MIRSSIYLCICLMLLASPMVRSQTAETEIGGPTRPYGPTHQTRSVSVGRNGMVCTSDVRASLAALEVLQRGGSAVDAAIAANAMLGVVEPMSCGIGGDLFAIVWNAEDRKLYGLNASGRSPRKLSLEEFTRRNLTQIPTEGPLSWSVPGCVSGWGDLHDKFGKLPWESLFASSIREAEEGFPVAPVISGYWQGAVRKLKSYPDSASTFLFDSARPPKQGDIFRNPRLAQSYRLIAEQGSQAFYHGSIADEIVRFSQANGGFFSREDFTEHHNTWVDPVSIEYRGHRVWELPPNGQGIAALEMLGILKQHDIAKLGWGTPEYLHLLIEAKKLAYADRARFYADPYFADVPTEQLISDQYAKQQASRIDPEKAAKQVEPGNPILAHGDTIYLCVVDKDRNCCSLIQSNFNGFGSGMVPGNVGFALQNRGALFALDPNHPNRFEPRKRPFHTIIPAMVTKDDRPTMVFGLMGGDMQAQGHVQVVVNSLDFGMNLQMAGDAARINHDGSATPTGTPMDPEGGVTQVEIGIPAATVEALKAKGHVIRVSKSSGFGGYQAIGIDWERGILEGATESRKDGIAIGY